MEWLARQVSFTTLPIQNWMLFALAGLIIGAAFVLIVRVMASR